MKTTLIYFDTIENSKKGTLRGLVAIITLILCDLIWFQILDYKKEGGVTKKFNYISAFLAWLLICSAIGVQLPSTYKEAVVYGILVGFVIYGVFNATNYAINKDWSLKLSILDTLWGMTVCGISSSIVYVIFHKK
tara:strand:- start:123 stop:527 length:405 start_codon:yes stop_codon:yes gene_type:complete